MKLAHSFTFFFLFAFIFANAQPYEHQYLVKVGDMAPDFQIKETSGKLYKLSDLRGSVVMLQFTASWCPVCAREMPHIEKRVWLPGKEKGLKVIGVDLDEPLEKVVAFAKLTNITYPLALDPRGDIFNLFAQKGAGVTRNVIIDRTGRIIFLTRLFKEEEFEAMRLEIFKALEEK
ncbi:MAG: TlpA disulfide reductase family protein [Salinivirgaceae bacterium]|jgi:peroxiredoxin|nr:TlpA disulfide reductase family protein [Salinivirgaceae bacterium]MDD4747415.1 TlpA disulfide reductase family protein [Salinivirgaceae bacterium]MDY0281655.1 TlpA disulfide reductase family protein [Salinivirgaceae bacterium]